MVTLPHWLRPLYPYFPGTFETARGASLSYIDEGEGRHAVLMLHGNPTWSFYYRHLVKALAPRRRCIAPDHVGMGLSEKPGDYPYTLQSRIDDITALVRSLELTRIDLVVHDWGGAIGFGLLERMPNLIGRIVILNTAVFPSRHIPRRIALCRTRGLGTWIVRGLNGFAAPATWMAMHRRALTDDEKQAYLWPYNSWAERVAIDAFLKDIPLSPRHPSWPALEAAERGITRVRNHPVLICWGGRDFCFDDHFFREWCERLPDAQTMYLPDVGHYVIEDAANEIVPRIAEFLTTNEH